MYVPDHFKLEDQAEIFALMRSYPFAAIITHSEDGLFATHIPTVLKPGEGALGSIECHLARANPQWKTIASGREALMIFGGPQAYVTPSWYPSKAEHGKVVPTWNYAVVHAYGVATAVDDRDWLMRHVSELSDQEEAYRAEPWSTADAPEKYMEAMLRGIVGVRFAVSRLEGKAKMSQNRSEADRTGVASGLSARGRESDSLMATWVAGKPSSA